jgi:membrane protein
MVGGLLREARALRPRAAWQEILRGFEQNDLLTYASAIAFQVAFALIPLALLALGVLGAFGLTDAWSSDIAPRFKESASPAAFKLVDETVRDVLEHKQLFWATIGLLIAVWKVSGAMRATMTVLNRIYRTSDDRTFWRRVFVSIWVSALVTVLLLGAVVCSTAIPNLDGPVAAIAGWAAALALLITAVGAIVRFAPSTERPFRWVSFGTLLVIVGWVASSLVYGWYVTSVADYGSVFGSLAVVMVTYGYLYLAAIVFLTGLQLDSLIRRQVEPTASAEHKLRGRANGRRVTRDEQRRHDRLAPRL